MPDLTKIATCSFCGSRTVLRLREVGNHHELSCANCAAPIHEMKPLKISAQPTTPRALSKLGMQKKKVKKKSRKPSHTSRILYKIAEELWDELEDIFD
ncbi:hypothetical protein GCM10008927_10280 [Amylibacter ulvae]|uniref:Uncharacterized protein n=1 Tax=Paramylibacter ulvae TaxID=1651968 RepID=A0ABQ3CY10_9RHOB|nr:hypothetical protein GCM10008927_10280 [Amylibacter ulvae]